MYRRQYHAERDLTGLVDRDAVQAQAAGEGAGLADGGGVTEGGFEVGLAEGGQPVDVDRIGTDDPGTPGMGQASMSRVVSVAIWASPRAADSRAAVSLPGQAGG